MELRFETLHSQNWRKGAHLFHRLCKLGCINGINDFLSVFMGQFIEDIFRLQKGAVDPGQAVNFRKDMLSKLSSFIKSAQCEKTVIPRVGEYS